jgi:glucose/arabinose dehydrogenase/mono/diheme cytochrome c family protein
VDRRLATVLLLSCAGMAWPRGARLDEAVEEPTGSARPGLLAIYRSPAESEASLSRIDPKPALWLEGGSIHPRLPPGPFEAAWTGLIRIDDGDGPAIRLSASVRGDVEVAVGGEVVLAGRGERDRSRVDSKAPLDLEPGLHRIEVRYRSPASAPARLQLWWEGSEFSPEPLPPWRLFHRPAELPPAAVGDLLAEEGRVAARRLGCAGCHAPALPGLGAPPAGPSLADIGRRAAERWLVEWLGDPSRLRAGARMPALFSPDRTGQVERWIVARHLAGNGDRERAPGGERRGDHRLGRRAFVSAGCAACHFLPDAPRAEQPDLGRSELAGLADRFGPADLAAFIADPLARYPDGRMPRIPIEAADASHIAAFLLLWSAPAQVSASAGEEPSSGEIDTVARHLGAADPREAAEALVREKRCAACHPGIGDAPAADIPPGGSDGSRGCLGGRTLPRFALDPSTRKALEAHVAAAARERHPSPFEERRRLLERSACDRCHQRDGDRPPPLEEAGSTLGGAWLQALPFQRSARLTHAHDKFHREHLVSAVRNGVSGLRPERYSYRMPAYGSAADDIVRAIAEADGEPTGDEEPPAAAPRDSTLAGLEGPALAGFQGYSCISCHIWKGKAFSQPDPGAAGTDLTRIAGRIRREWFGRFLEAPSRAHPRTPMPAFFPKGRPAGLRSSLGGDAARQKEALWSYLALGGDAPSPKPAPPLAVEPPPAGGPPIAASIPVRLPGDVLVDAICVITGSHDIIVHDIASGSLDVYTGARLLRDVQGRLRRYTVTGTKVEMADAEPARGIFRGHDLLPDGVRIRRASRDAPAVESAETIRIVESGGDRRLVREVESGGKTIATSRELPARMAPPPIEAIQTPDAAVLADTASAEGVLERPGYRAVAFPRPRRASGEDVLMPGAVAVDPRDGRVFVASMKLGEVFLLEDPSGDGRSARFVDWARGLFQEVYSMLAEEGALYILHRRSLTRAADTDRDGLADRFDRIAFLPQGIADDYDYAYGLVRDRTGAFIVSHAPHGNHGIPGSGGVLRLDPRGEMPPVPIAFGLRNPLGWCADPDGEVFFTDNQGEWVAANKLCHVVEGRYYGFPNPAQKEHAAKPPGRTAVWVPYAWAKSVNGVTRDSTGGKFGPFAGQFFLAELMFGGAIIRASLEKVRGEYQGACFPFWGKGLLGPLVLAFDPGGRLFVGSITEPGWMSQPDRGALFRIDFTGETPFEMETIRALPGGFRILFTEAPASESALAAASYRVERYRYEYTGAYGSPELDRTDVPVERVEPSAGGRGVDLLLPPLVKDRVYRITAAGVRSRDGRPLVHATGAYTLNELPEAGENHEG